MKNRIIIILATLLMGQPVFAQELSRTKGVLDTIPTNSEVPHAAMQSSSWSVSSRLPYAQPIPPVSNNRQPALLNDSILSRGSHDPLQAIAPLQTNDNYNAQPMMSFGGWHIIGTSGLTTIPGMMETGSAAVGLNRSFGPLTINIGVDANRYHANIMDNPFWTSQGIHSMATQYGVGGALSLRLNDQWSITAYGQYYDRNPYFFMAAYPYVQTSTYGAYATYSKGVFGMDLGARRYFDAFARKWITAPIITPKFKLANKFWLELPVGDLVRSGLENAIHHRHGL